VPYDALVVNHEQVVTYVNRRHDRTPVGNHLICDVMSCSQKADQYSTRIYSEAPLRFCEVADLVRITTPHEARFR
jgi:hypothetical protein